MKHILAVLAGLTFMFIVVAIPAAAALTIRYVLNTPYDDAVAYVIFGILLIGVGYMIGSFFVIHDSED
jgi:hypothetical protein